MTTTTTKRTYWASTGGEIVCDQHLGYSATAELQANPKARTLYGACDTWHRMTKTELADWLTFLAEHGHTEACESCRGGW
jgi:uncharacterized protein YqiB (DUF1249 family)